MGSRLTEPEVDAALQLIQLSGDSTDSKLGNGTFPDLEKEEEESVGNTTGSTAEEISSTLKNNSNTIIEENLDDEACPPRQRKFRSILDIYMNTRPLIKKPGKKPTRKI